MNPTRKTRFSFIRILCKSIHHPLLRLRVVFLFVPT